MSRLADIELHVRSQQSVFALDHRRSLDDLHVGDHLQRDLKRTLAAAPHAGLPSEVIVGALMPPNRAAHQAVVASHLAGASCRRR